MNMHAAPLGVVRELVRYPVKSMLGEPCDEIAISRRGLAGDRRYAVLDVATQRIASAKKPALWRSLLACRVRVPSAGNAPVITFPDGEDVAVDSARIDELLSRFLGRAVRLVQTRPPNAEIERARPEEVVSHGPTADVAVDIGRLGRAAPEGGFFDYAPVHLLTTGGVDALAQGPDALEPARYRPNIFIETPAGSPFPEDAWVGRDLLVGDSARLRVLLPTPRCAVPTLAHGELSPRTEAITRIMQAHRIPVEGVGVLPCLGAYAQVIEGGAIRCGDAVRLADA